MRAFVFSSKIGSGHKTIGKYRLTYANLFYDETTNSIIQTLELIQNANKIIDMDYEQYMAVRTGEVFRYLDYQILAVLNEIHYQYATVATFDRQLKEGQCPSTFFEEYKEKHADGTYLLLPK